MFGESVSFRVRQRALMPATNDEKLIHYSHFFSPLYMQIFLKQNFLYIYVCFLLYRKYHLPPNNWPLT